MITKPNNWDNVQAFSDGQALPLGAYVCRVKSVKIEQNQYGSQMMIAFDIDEGEHKDFYQKQFAANTAQDKKWKGVLRQWLPLNNGEERDEITKRSLKGLTTAFERSNSGFIWNWDEQALVGKVIGILFRREEYSVEGRRGWSVRPFRAITVERVRSNDYTLPEDKPVRSDAAEPSFTPAYNAPKAPAAQQTSMMQNGFTAVVDDDLPF